MNVTQITENLYEIAFGGVNAFLIDDKEAVLIDTGVPGSTDDIITALNSIGKQATDLRHIVVTHCHPDHAGSLAELKRVTGAAAYMHPLEATVTKTGKLNQDMMPAPGMEEMFNQLIGYGSAEYEAANVEQEVEDGDELPLAGGLSVIHAPGHSQGQIVLFWKQHGGVLFAADTCSNMMGLGYSLGYHDFNAAMSTLVRLGQLDFAIACFGHGKTIPQGAAKLFRQRWVA